MMQTCRRMVLATMVLIAAGDALAAPLPVGNADVSLAYTSAAGPVVLSDQRDFSGTGLGDALAIGGDPNVTYFGSVNAFGRRPLVPGAIGANESLLAGAFFKPIGFTTDFFAGITAGSDITVSMANVQFDQPVNVQTDTVLLHRFWVADQLDTVDVLNGSTHTNTHNHDTSNPFRNQAAFVGPVFNGAVSDVAQRLVGANALQVTGNGTDTVSLSITFPYEFFRHLEEDANNPLNVPAGLPAPHGFLEPFHFHVEVVVAAVPEPTSCLLLTSGAVVALRRRRRVG